MSDIFDTISDTMIMAGRELENTAKDLTSKAKLQYEIKQREGYLSELYKELGKEYYTKNKDEKAEDENFKEISELISELSELRKDYNDLKGAKTCPHCGAQVAKDSDYCGKCGKPLFEEQ